MKSEYDFELELKSVKKMLSHPQIIYCTENCLQRYDFENGILALVPLGELSNHQKSQILSLVLEHNSQLFDFISNAMKQQIKELNV